MEPSVFVSSTIEDLSHLRSAVRDLLLELGYIPIMSEYGDVAYMGDNNVIEGCLNTAKACDLGVLIVGKSYHAMPDGFSVTYREFEALRDQKKPMISLVARELLNYKSVYDQNRAASISWPGMDNAPKTFELIDAINAAKKNNAVVPFQTASEACFLLKRQIALWVGDMVKSQHEEKDIKDVLSEVQALRLELSTEKSQVASMYSKLLRALMDDENVHYKELLDAAFLNIEPALKAIVDGEDFASMIGRSGHLLRIDSSLVAQIRDHTNALPDIQSATLWQYEEEIEMAAWAVSKAEVIVTPMGLRALQEIHSSLLAVLQPPRKLPRGVRKSTYLELLSSMTDSGPIKVIDD